MPLTFELVSPERKLASTEADAVTIPGVEGDMTAMPSHAPYLTTLRPGYVVVRSGSSETRYFITGGFAEISNDVVSVLADRAVEASQVDAGFMDERIAEAERAAEDAPAERSIAARQRLSDFRAARDRL